MNSRICPRCNFNISVKIGTTSSGRQRYRCKNCHKTWTTKSHPQVLSKAIWDDLVFHNMNLKELANKYHCNVKTIRRKLDLYDPLEIVPTHQVDVIGMDVTYFGRSGGILSVIDVITGDTLYCKEVGAYETVEDYEDALLFLFKHDVHPKAAVVDGKKGVIDMLESYGILVQMCQFHQKKIVTSCITRKPILPQNIELKHISDAMTHLNREKYEIIVYYYRANNWEWLHERTRLEDGKWEYTHKLSRRAINSIFHHLPYLFTFEDYPNLNIPNTNNKIEGIHSELKRRLANHRGLKKSQKIKFVRIFLSGRTGA